MRIIELQVENVMRLRALRMNPDKTLVKIEGRNAQGKSSVLYAIGAALGGGKQKIDMPIRKGEEKAFVQLDIGDENEVKYVVRRQWNASGHTSLVITLPDGTPQKSPQAILDGFVSDRTFDPLSFVRMKPKEQADVLKKLAGLDFTAMDAERETLYAQRTNINRESKTAEAAIGAPPPTVASDTPIDISELVAKQQEANDSNNELDRSEEQLRLAEQALLSLKNDLPRARGKVGDVRLESAKAVEKAEATAKAIVDDAKAAAKKSVEEAESDLESGQSHIAEAEKGISEINQALEGVDRFDTSNVANEIKEAEQNNDNIKARKEFQQRKELAKSKQAESEKLSNAIKKIDDDKSRALRSAKFPLEGLGIDVNGPTLNDIPFSQASLAEQMRASVAMGLAEKKPARIMLVHNGSLLDDDSLKLLNDIVEEFDAQCFIERVAKSASPSAVYIEDGEIVETCAEPPDALGEDQ